MIPILLFVMGAVTWLIGGNLLVAFHYRRLGQSIWTGLKPFRFPFFRFNVTEWLVLATLMVMSLGLIGLALTIDPTVPSSLFLPRRPNGPSG
jgi:hypothetical protein